MRYFIIATRLDTGRKQISGLSVASKYVAERNLANRLAMTNRTLAIEFYPTVAAASAAIAAHNEHLPVFAEKLAA